MNRLFILIIVSFFAMCIIPAYLLAQQRSRGAAAEKAAFTRAAQGRPMQQQTSFSRTFATSMDTRSVDPAQAQFMQEGRQPPQQVTASQEGQIGGAFATPLEEEVKKRRKESEAGEKEIDTRIKADEESYQAEREKYFEEELKPEEIRAAEEEERERKSLIDEINKRIEEKRRKTYGIRELETYTQDEKDKIAKALVRSGLSPFTVKELMSEIRNEQSLYAILSLYEYNPQEIKVIADSVIPPEKR